MRRSLMRMFCLAAASALILSPQIEEVTAKPTSRTALFDVTVKDGKVDRIIIRVPATRDEYLIDRFVDDDDAIAQEAEAFTNAYGFPGCTVTGSDRKCRTACAFAENARPFTRLRRQTADGRVTTLWPRGEEGAAGRALKFYAGASSASSHNGDCVSPDGRFISLYGYPAPYEGERGKNPGIYALSPDLPAASFQGLSSGKTYGDDRYFLFAGWKKGKPHTLLFNWGGDDGTGKPTDDEALLLR